MRAPVDACRCFARPPPPFPSQTWLCCLGYGLINIRTSLNHCSGYSSHTEASSPLAAVQGTSLFLPTVIRTLGTYTTVEVQLRSVPPYVVATAWSIFIAYMWVSLFIRSGFERGPLSGNKADPFLAAGATKPAAMESGLPFPSSSPSLATSVSWLRPTPSSCELPFNLQSPKKSYIGLCADNSHEPRCRYAMCFLTYTGAVPCGPIFIGEHFVELPFSSRLSALRFFSLGYRQRFAVDKSCYNHSIGARSWYLRLHRRYCEWEEGDSQVRRTAC